MHVTFAFRMLRTICFNNQLVLLANEIHNKRSNRLLAAKFGSGLLASPEDRPELALSLCHVSAQALGAA